MLCESRALTVYASIPKSQVSQSVKAGINPVMSSLAVEYPHSYAHATWTSAEFLPSPRLFQMLSSGSIVHDLPRVLPWHLSCRAYSIALMISVVWLVYFVSDWMWEPGRSEAGRY